MSAKLLLCVLPLTLAACALPPPQAFIAPSAAEQAQTGLPVATVVLRSPAGKTIRVEAEIAATDTQRAIGLMGRTELPEGKGMLFVFPEEQRLSFWMKHTLIPLYVLYFRADGSFVSAQSMTPCTADPCALYPSDGSAKYALEIRPGSVDVGEGWRIVLPKGL